MKYKAKQIKSLIFFQEGKGNDRKVRRVRGVQIWMRAEKRSRKACPICATRVGMDLIGHLTMQHGSYFKISFFNYAAVADHLHFYIFHIILQLKIHRCHGRAHVTVMLNCNFSLVL
ncbi:ubiquitin carrier protein 7, partial [Zea mays]